MNFVDFLKTRREALGYSQNKFAKLINITQSYLNSIEREEVKNPPSEEVLERIADGLGLNSEEKKEFLFLAAIERTPKIIIDRLNELRSDLEIQSKTNSNTLLQNEGNIIPVFDRISAGPGAFSNEEVTDFIALPGIKNTNNIFAVNVVGDSMEPTIKDGSIIICKKNVEIRNGEIGAFFIDDEAYVKRLKVTKNYIALISDNPNYAPIYVGPGENLHAVGKVIKVLSDM